VAERGAPGLVAAAFAAFDQAVPVEYGWTVLTILAQGAGMKCYLSLGKVNGLGKCLIVRDLT
jgi:hypothetical protein